jgi:hypothetical protein
LLLELVVQKARAAPHPHTSTGLLEVLVEQVLLAEAAALARAARQLQVTQVALVVLQVVRAEQQ